VDDQQSLDGSEVTGRCRCEPLKELRNEGDFVECVERSFAKHGPELSRRFFHELTDGLAAELLEFFVPLLTPDLFVGVQQHGDVVAHNHLVVESLDSIQAAPYELLGGLEEAIASIYFIFYLTEIDLEQVFKEALTEQTLV